MFDFLHRTAVALMAVGFAALLYYRKLLVPYL